MTVYLASPGSQMHGAALYGMPVLLSFGAWSDWIMDYQQSFGRILIDSGAFGELTGNAKIDLREYRKWCDQWIERDRVDAIAGLDDISGDWRRSLKNYDDFPESFPTFHPGSDPWELLPDLCAMASERSGWIGIGVVPPREEKREYIARALSEIPPSLHVHGFALRFMWGVRGIHSVDSTNWWRDAFQYKKRDPWLTPAQAVQMVVWRYQQEARFISRKTELGPIQKEMFP